MVCLRTHMTIFLIIFLTKKWQKSRNSKFCHYRLNHSFFHKGLIISLFYLMGRVFLSSYTQYQEQYRKIFLVFPENCQNQGFFQGSHMERCIYLTRRFWSRILSYISNLLYKKCVFYSSTVLTCKQPSFYKMFPK